MTGKLIFPMALVCILFCSCAEDNMATLKKRGLIGRVTYRVVDEAGSPVTNASVQVAFQSNSSKSKLVRGVTDTNGMFTAEARVQFRANAQFAKNGYYRSSHEYMFFTIDQSRMKDGKWLPWNPTIDITMYPKLNRRKSPKKSSYCNEHLVQGVTYGFDMLKKDIVAPGGKGEFSDFTFNGAGRKIIVTGKNTRGINIFFTNDFNVVFSNEGDGVVRMKRRPDSEFKFTYFAPETGYVQRMHFYEDYSPQRPEGRGDPFPTDNDYFIFRISRKDDESSEMKKYYGIIIRLWGTATRKDERTFDIWYYLNPIPGDRNIEYGP